MVMWMVIEKCSVLDLKESLFSSALLLRSQLAGNSPLSSSFCWFRSVGVYLDHLCTQDTLSVTHWPSRDPLLISHEVGAYCLCVTQWGILLLPLALASEGEAYMLFSSSEASFVSADSRLGAAVPSGKQTVWGARIWTREGT